MNKVIWSKKSDHFKSPQWIMDAYADFFDPCPLNAKFDGLHMPWKAFNYCNPPYSEISVWIRKAILESEERRTTIMLLPARTDTKWFHDLLYGKYEIKFIKGRLKFGDAKKSAPFPNMFVRIQNNFFREP